jgi:hypothetical protein
MKNKYLNQSTSTACHSELSRGIFGMNCLTVTKDSSKFLRRRAGLGMTESISSLI